MTTNRTDHSPFTSSAFDASAHNPFAAAAKAEADRYHVPEDAAPGTYGFEVLKSGPSVRSEEVEEAAARVVEVTVSWGSNVLLVRHIDQGRSFVLGTDADRGVDFVVPAEALASVDGGHHTLLTGGDVALVAAPGEAPTPLAEGAVRDLAIGELKVRVQGMAAGKKVGLGLAFDLDVAPYLGLSAAVIGGFLLSLFYATPAYALRSPDEIDADKMRLVKAYLDAAAMRDNAQKPVEQADGEVGKEDGGGDRHRGKSGAAGNPDSKKANGRLAVAGKKTPQEAKLSRAEAIRQAETFGMAGFLASFGAGQKNAPTSPFVDTQIAEGADPLNALGQLTGGIGDAHGAGGLGLSGSGLGGDGSGLGVGIGPGTGIGPGAGNRYGPGFGPGNGHGLRPGSRRPGKPDSLINDGDSQVSGRIPPSVIQRIVRQNFGRFRACYQSGLARNPELAGTVRVAFAVTSAGTTQVAGAGGSLPDSAVVSCVASAFGSLSFPAPEDGVVRVSYTVSLSPMS